MSKVRVPVFGTVGKSVAVNTDASFGAQFGVDLFDERGNIVTTARLAKLIGDALVSSDKNEAIFETEIVDDAILARVAEDETISGTWAFQTAEGGGSSLRILLDDNLSTPPSDGTFNHFGTIDWYDADQTDQLAYMGFDNELNFGVENMVRGGRVDFLATQDDGTTVDLLRFDPNGDIEFYYQGTRAMEIIGAGDLVAYSEVNTDTTNIGFQMRWADATSRGFFGLQSEAFKIENDIHGGTVEIALESSSGGEYTVLEASENWTRLHVPDSSNRIQLHSDSVVHYMGMSEVRIRDGATLRIEDAGDTDRMAMSHDGADFNFAAVNTSEVNFTGADRYKFDAELRVDDSGGFTAFWVDHPNDRIDIRDGYTLRLRDSGDTDYLDIRHDGTDATFDATNTTRYRFKSIGRMFIEGVSTGASLEFRTDVSDQGIIRPNNDFTRDLGFDISLDRWFVEGAFQINADLRVTGNGNFFGGSMLRVWDSGNSDRMDMSHDGADFTFNAVNTTDVAFTGADGDYLFDRPVKLGVFTDATRPAAGVAGRVIFNSDDGQLNVDDGTNWTLPDGTTT